MEGRSSPSAGEIFNEWKSSDALCARGSRGYLANIAKNRELNRAEVAHNYEILAPIIRHLGFLPPSVPCVQ